MGTSAPFVAAVELCRAIAPSDVPVLLSGETGTGKEALGAAVHRWSRRRGKAFVTCNCAAIPDALLESELFGHVRGAFAGASGDRGGSAATGRPGSTCGWSRPPAATSR